MKVAIFYTGCLRTFEKTTPHNRQNLLFQNDPQQVDLFACIQNDTSNSEPEIAEKLSKLYVNKEGHTVVKSIKWFNNDDPQFNEWKNALVDGIEVSDGWKHYLKNSGSITEYVQFTECWKQMAEYEQTVGQKYNYVVRLRTDIVIATPLNFTLLEKAEKTQDGLMNWLSAERKQQGDFIEIKESNPEPPPSQNGSWLLSIRKNLLYIMPRTTAETVSELSGKYGSIKPQTLKQQGDYAVWMDAESQLQLACLQNGITIFDSTTRLEEKSVYEFKRNIYFDYDEKGEYLIPSSQYASFAYR